MPSNISPPLDHRCHLEEIVTPIYPIQDGCGPKCSGWSPSEKSLCILAHCLYSYQNHLFSSLPIDSTSPEHQRRLLWYSTVMPFNASPRISFWSKICDFIQTSSFNASRHAEEKRHRILNSFGVVASQVALDQYPCL